MNTPLLRPPDARCTVSCALASRTFQVLTRQTLLPGRSVVAANLCNGGAMCAPRKTGRDRSTEGSLSALSGELQRKHVFIAWLSRYLVGDLLLRELT